MHVIDQKEPPSVERKKMCYHSVTLPDPIVGEILSECFADCLIFAAGGADVRQSLQYPHRDFHLSTEIYYWVLDQIRRFSPKTKIIFFSSAAVYGNPEKLPITEDSPLKPMSPYGYHKLLCEKISEEFATLFDMQIINYRIFSVFGPGLRRQVVWDITRKHIISEEGIIELFGTGQEIRDFIAVEDLAVIIRKTIEMTRPLPFVMNLSSGRELSIHRLAETIIKLLDSTRKITFTGHNDRGMPDKWWADISRIKENGIYACGSFENRLKNTISWIKSELRKDEL